jgi:plastocyanin
MKPNLYYIGILAATLLVLSGPAGFATPTDTTQLTGTTEQTPIPEDETVTVAIGQGSTPTVQQFTYTPQTVEINAGESVTWLSPAEITDFHTVTFRLDQNVVSELLMPFAVPAGTQFELLPPFNVGDPFIILTPDGGEAILAANYQYWYPSAVDANNQTTFLNGTDIQYTMDGTEKVINSGIILPPFPPTDEFVDQNTTSTDGEGEIREIPGAAPTNETMTMGNATTDILTAPEEEATSEATEGGEPPIVFPFPIVSSFTVTFEEPGEYPYFCAVHPWMTGQVVVRGETPTEEQPQAQTPTEEQPQAQTPTEEQPQAQTPTEEHPQAPTELESPNPIFG